MSLRSLLLFLLFGGSLSLLTAQHDDQTYYPVEDPLVQEKLDQWQDMKFGLLMHWGAYSQWGIVESWSICPEDYGWCQRKKEGTPDTYFEYVQAYENLQTTFNPTQFAPEKWAAAAKDAGMKYLVFTTKHHDGFSMFDSKYTDYKVTDEKTPFSSHPRANITAELFDAFRDEGLWAGAYFSKPDWHSDDYWWPYFPPKDRNVNYDPEAYPERWERFVQYTHNQIMELMTDYGKVDILWLDGGWVQKSSKDDLQDYYVRQMAGLQTGFQKSSMVNQDIRMDELVEKAREKQPGLIVVDRAVEGPNQNYLTPENRVPETALPYPWESCIIAGGGWSYTPNAQYMSGHRAIHMLIDIVCKGGNLLYNIAPGPDGTWHQDAYALLADMGDWIEVNGEAIYATRAIEPYATGKISYTRKKDSNTLYAIYRAAENETIMPALIQIDDFAPEAGSKVFLLGHDRPLTWTPNGTGFTISIPKALRQKPPGKYAWSFGFRSQKSEVRDQK
jgi:alpha-L-fucosidase